jgi:hypothetical protein
MQLWFWPRIDILFRVSEQNDAKSDFRVSGDLPAGGDQVVSLIFSTPSLQGFGEEFDECCEAKLSVQS